MLYDTKTIIVIVRHVEHQLHGRRHVSQRAVSPRGSVDLGVTLCPVPSAATVLTATMVSSYIIITSER